MPLLPELRYIRYMSVTALVLVRMAHAEHPHRDALLAACLAMIWCTGGAVYGWASMRTILRRDGVLRDECPSALNASIVCDSQESKFSTIVRTHSHPARPLIACGV